MGTRIPFMKLCPHDNYLLKVPPPNVITMEIRFQHRNFGRTHSVHSIRYTNSVLYTVEGLTGIMYSSSNCRLDLSEPKVCSLSIWHEISNLHCTMYTHSHARKHMLTIYIWVFILIVNSLMKEFCSCFNVSKCLTTCSINEQSQ